MRLTEWIKTSSNEKNSRKSWYEVSDFISMNYSDLRIHNKIKSQGKITSAALRMYCHNSLIYYVDRFYTYRKQPNNMDSEVVLHGNQLIREYKNHT